ncbi:hypothetical protein ACFQZS_04220 [Mucilaginibacter calamicampi]|uniref:Uncharacterized protein n=1 Tax=Mucilaginibacter calamicampi TaxID=1302352 RepID=A0ABW2YTY5_9SPHI
MQSPRKKSFKKITKYVLAGALTFGLTQISASVMAQSAPPAPPPPDKVFKKVGADLKRINPFKKGKTPPAPGAKAGLPSPGTPPAGGPPAPPNPLNLFKKKPAAPPKPPGA